MCVSCGENIRETDDGHTLDRPSILYMVKYSHSGLEQVHRQLRIANNCQQKKQEHSQSIDIKLYWIRYRNCQNHLHFLGSR